MIGAASERLDSLKQKVNVLKGAKTALEAKLKRTSEHLNKSKDDSELLELTRLALSSMTENKVGPKITYINDMVTYGLNSVFHDRDLRFELSIKDSTKKLSYTTTTWDGLQVASSDTDGAVTVVEGFLLRLICLIELKKPKFLIMDEHFAAVGATYINNLAKLLDELSESMGVDILLVSHNSGTAHKTEYQLYMDPLIGGVSAKVISSGNQKESP